jgi:cysteine desulfurase
MFSFLKKKKQNIYLDHAATTPLDRRVLEVMNNVYTNNYFNSSSWYRGAVETGRLIEQSRATVAKLLDTQSRNIFFTNGGTESNNMAVMGIIEKYKKDNSEIPHIICSNIEHPAVLHTLQNLSEQGSIELDILPVRENGIIDISDLKKILKPNTALVAIMYANNEIGTVQPIREITKLVRWYRKQTGNTVYPLVHTDAIQATNYLDMSVVKLGVDSMSISGSKIYGPKSAGVLYMKNPDLCVPIMYGGEQEMGLRPGTLDPASIVGMTRALQLVRSDYERESCGLTVLRDSVFKKLQQHIPGVIINGSVVDRLPNNINITVPGISSEELVIRCSAAGFDISAKSACSLDRDADDSHVINALRAIQPHPLTPSPTERGDTADSVSGSIRITMGRSTTQSDMDMFVKTLVKIVGDIQENNNKLGIH